MATITHTWKDGGGTLTVVYGGAGSGQVTISSTPNTLPVERTANVIFTTADKSKSATLKVTQAAATKDYVDTNGVWHVHNGSVSGTTLTLNDYTMEDKTTKYKY